MPEIETLGILEEIEALVSDRLQVVSYKWLSRNFSVSSNTAKKLLQEFVEKHEHGLQVVYSVAGWLKKVPATYHIRLVTGPKLAEAKQEFDNCSVQVYSVQVCIPKDPATIWNAEFIQAEELFKQPSAVDTCLRYNRFCGISNSFVKCNAEGAPLSSAAPQAKSPALTGLAPDHSANQTSAMQQPQQKKLQQSSTKVALNSPNATTVGTGTDRYGSCDPQNEALEKNKTSVANAKKGQSDKSSSGAGGSIANFWGRASTKSKSSTCSAEEKNLLPKTDDSADAHVRSCEASEAASSDNDESDINFKRSANGDGGKKRRVVMDDSDEEDYENAVNLGSPDPPKVQSIQTSKQKTQMMNIEKNSLNFDEQNESKPVVKEEKAADVGVNHPSKKESSVVKSASIATSKEISHGRTTDGSNGQKAVASVPGSPKRRKVLKTQIDDRGREVTEVVWEGEETDVKDKNAGEKSVDNVQNLNDGKMKVEDKAATHTVSRFTATKKSPAVGSTVPSHATGKAGNKKGANVKDPKQGNILSFFKRV